MLASAPRGDAPGMVHALGSPFEAQFAVKVDHLEFG
jgi:hypothetical protein